MNTVPETLYSEAKMIDKGIMPKPRMAIFYPTYKCNQNCSYCFYKDWNNKNIPEPIEKVKDVFKQLKELEVTGIEFCGGGEPLCAPEIKDIFKMANDMGFKIGLLTNGSLFEEDIAETFLKYGTYVRFSLETVNRELYKKIRGADDCERVLENIKSALEIKKKINSKCDISVKIGLSKDIGVEQIHAVYAYFENYDLSNIQVKCLWDSSGNYYNKDINRVDLEKYQEGLTIPVVKKVHYPRFMNEQCWITPTQIMVDVYGDFYLCCYYMYRKESHRVGNIFETPLKELWGSEIHKKAISNIKISECLKHNCRFQKHMRVIRRRQESGEWEFL